MQKPVFSSLAKVSTLIVQALTAEIDKKEGSLELGGLHQPEATESLQIVRTRAADYCQTRRRDNECKCINLTKLV